MSTDGDNRQQTVLLQNIWNELKTLGSHLNRRIDETNESLGKRIDETNESLGKRIDETNESLGKRIDSLEASVGKRFDAVDKHFDVMEGVLRDLSGQQLLLTRYVKNVLARDITELRDRVTTLEEAHEPG